jgi:hypothetical protein
MTYGVTVTEVVPDWRIVADACHPPDVGLDLWRAEPAVALAPPPSSAVPVGQLTFAAAVVPTFPVLVCGVPVTICDFVTPLGP